MANYRIGGIEDQSYRIGAAEDARGMKLRPSGNATIRYYLSGLGRTTLATTVAGTLTTGALQRPFRAERLLLSRSCAPALDITALAAGADSVLVGANSVPGEFFAEDAVGVNLTFPSLGTGLALTVGVTNNSAAQTIARGAFSGYVAVIPG